MVGCEFSSSCDLQTYPYRKCMPDALQAHVVSIAPSTCICRSRGEFRRGSCRGAGWVELMLLPRWIPKCIILPSPSLRYLCPIPNRVWLQAIAPIPVLPDPLAFLCSSRDPKPSRIVCWRQIGSFSAVRGVAHLLLVQLQCLVPTAIIFNHSLPSAALDPRVPQPSGLFRMLFLLLPKSPHCMRKQGKISLSLALAYSWAQILQVSQLPNPSCSLRFGLITNRESSAWGAHKFFIARSLCPITDPVAFLLPSHEISNQHPSLTDQLLCIAQTLGLQKSRRLKHH